MKVNSIKLFVYNKSVLVICLKDILHTTIIFFSFSWKTAKVYLSADKQIFFMDFLKTHTHTAVRKRENKLVKTSHGTNKN